MLRNTAIVLLSISAIAQTVTLILKIIDAPKEFRKLQEKSKA